MPIFQGLHHLAKDPICVLAVVASQSLGDDLLHAHASLSISQGSLGEGDLHVNNVGHANPS